MSGVRTVVLDANVLFPFALRDLLLRIAEAGFFRPRWSPTIIDEVTRNLVSQRGISDVQASRLVDAMNGAFPEACVTDHAQYIPMMKNDRKDRHVLAAAVASKSAIVVTQNLKDFRWTPPGIAAMSADTFVCCLHINA